MVKVHIATEWRDLEDADPQWINEQIDRRRAAGHLVCVQVAFDESHIHMTLSTVTCRGGGGGYRRPTPEEKQIQELWNKLGLNEHEFDSGNVVAFTKQVRHLLA